MDLLPWIGEETGNTNSLGVNSPVLSDHLTIWDRKPEDPDKSADFAWTLVSCIREISSTPFGIFFDRVGIAEGISTGLLLYLRVYLLPSVQVLISF